MGDPFLKREIREYETPRIKFSKHHNKGYMMLVNHKAFHNNRNLLDHKDPIPKVPK